MRGYGAGVRLGRSLALPGSLTLTYFRGRPLENWIVALKRGFAAGERKGLVVMDFEKINEYGCFARREGLKPPRWGPAATSSGRS